VPGPRRATAAMPGAPDGRPAARMQSPVTTPPIATIGAGGIPMPTGGFDGRPLDDDSEPRADHGRVRTANLVHRPASTNVRVLVGAVVLVLLVVIPGILVLQARGANPAIDRLNALSLPSWGAQHPQDHASGSRWCLRSCMVTERTWDSDRPVADTASAYADALKAAGWTPANTCSKFPDGVQTCWVLDQNELDLTVGKSPCALGTPPPNVHSVDGVPPDPSSKPPAGCAQTSVHAKVTDQINVAVS
jgi:hypothetical protein